MKLAVPDLVSVSYFPAIAAVELGFFAQEGLDVKLELMVPVETAFDAMQRGEVQFIAGSAHLMVCGFPEWKGVRLLCAQSQGMYWFLVARPDLGIARGDLAALRGRRIGAVPWVAMGLRQLLREAGLDPAANDIDIAPIPGTHEPGMSFGVNAAKALEDGRVDAFWANGMGAELALRRGAGTLVLDARRDADARNGFGFTQPSIGATEAFVTAEPLAAAAAVRAIARTHRALKADISLAAEVGRKLFPAEEASLLPDLIARDLLFYDTTITPDFVASMTRFSRAVGILQGSPGYTDVVATEFAPLWQS